MLKRRAEMIYIRSLLFWFFDAFLTRILRKKGSYLLVSDTFLLENGGQEIKWISASEFMIINYGLEMKKGNALWMRTIASSFFLKNELWNGFSFCTKKSYFESKKFIMIIFKGSIDTSSFILNRQIENLSIQYSSK